jgi:glycosyltransferase involved in cell wall biosynthesis
MQPLISCIMPTYNRRAFVPQAIRYFLGQTYPNRELIIVDDGSDSIHDLVPANDCIRYIRLGQKATIGTKRNIACAAARGAIIVHWDDDDWHAPYQLSYQANALLHAGTDMCGVKSMLYLDLRSRSAWSCTCPSKQQLWLAGNALCYRKEFWALNNFEDIQIGEDNDFILRAEHGQITELSGSILYVGVIHGDNISPKTTDNIWWKPYPTEKLVPKLGKSWAFYSAIPAFLKD